MVAILSKWKDGCCFCFLGIINIFSIFFFGIHVFYFLSLKALLKTDFVIFLQHWSIAKYRAIKSKRIIVIVVCFYSIVLLY